MNPTPISSFLVNMWPPSVLLKRPVVAEHIVSEFESRRKHFVYVLLMINSCLLKNHQTRYFFGTYSKPNRNFFRKFLYLLDATFCISFGTTWCPDYLVLRIINSIDVEQFFVKSQCPLCESSLVSNFQISIFLLYGLQRVLAELCSYMI